jgi:hypothetical protein
VIGYSVSSLTLAQVEKDVGLIASSLVVMRPIIRIVYTSIDSRISGSGSRRSALFTDSDGVVVNSSKYAKMKRERTHRKASKPTIHVHTDILLETRDRDITTTTTKVDG